jgi:hypothetical protein
MLRTADEAAAMMPWVAVKFDGRIWRLDLYLFKFAVNTESKCRII